MKKSHKIPLISNEPVHIYFFQILGYDGMDFLNALHSHVYKIVQDPTQYQIRPPINVDTLSNKDIEKDDRYHDNEDDSDSEEKKRLASELLSVSGNLIVPPSCASTKDITSCTSNLDVDVTLEKM